MLGSRSMFSLGLKEDVATIGPVAAPHAIDDTNPDVREGANGYAMALAFGALAVVVLFCPGFRSGGEPCEAVQGIAERLDTGHSLPSPDKAATLKRHGRGAGQGCNTLM